MVGKNTRRDPDAPLPPPIETDRRWDVESKGELRRMLFTPNGSWYGLLDESCLECFKGVEVLIGEDVEEDVVGMAEGGHGS